MIGEIMELRRLLKNRKLSSDELEDLQRRKLRAVIRNAYEKVPYYRSLFKSEGLSPEDIHTADDLKQVPITTKDDLRAAGVERIIAKDIKLSSCTSIPTSGTTGEPFTTHLTGSDLRTRRLIEFRTLLSVGFRQRDRLAVLGPEWPHRSRLHQRLGFYRSENINQFRLIQESFDHLTLQLVFRGNLQDETLIKIQSRFMEYLGESVRLDIQIVDFIEEEKLKFRSFISKLPKSDL